MANPFDLTRGLFQGGTQQEPVWSPVPTEQEIRNEQLMNSIDSTLKNWGAAMALRNATKKQPQQAASVQEQNLRQAEQDLREAREADAQSGSEGYEAKENGVFSRLASWGNSVGEYLFGKDTRSEAEKLADEVLEKAEAERIAKEKEERGILGYYGGNALGALVGTDFKKDWQDIKKNVAKQGLLGYVPQKVNETLETMAQSPMSNFVDPTTALGGRQTMVQNLDNYFASRGLQGVKADALAQRKLETELAKTALGQARTLMSLPPEQRAAYAEALGQLKGRGAAGTTYKTLQAAAVDFPRVLEESLGYTPTLQEVERAWNDRYSVPYREALQRPTAGAGGIVKTPLQQAQRDVVDLVNSGVPFGDAMQEVSDRTGFTRDELSGKKAPSTYQPSSISEKQESKQREKAGEQLSSIVAKELADYDSNYDKTLRGLQILRSELSKPENKDMFGGWFNDTIQKAATQLGVTTKNKQEALAAFNNALRSMHAEATRQIDPSGRLTDAEQRRIDSTIIDMSMPVEYNKKMVDDAISRMALGKAAVEEKFNLVYNGFGPQDVSDFLNNKYYYMRLYPQQYIDPALVEREKYKKGQFVWSNEDNDWRFVEETD